MLNYRTKSLPTAEVQKHWFLVDAQGKTLGRLASEIAKVIRGKHKPSFTPHINCGDNVIVINAEKISVTSDKESRKEYISYSEYPGGQKRRSLKEMRRKTPNKIIEKAVKGMLPKNRLGRDIFHNLKVYSGAEHPHEAQKPQTLEIS
ncbi:MAG: 50S ribosomal protein L13 [Bacteroidetes bacterium MED-G17]|jgi:large subunit ribosomal protein L13|nr:MAG: 50S ribosomal protein L13 [Bacteroidetes bacterium MED-G17]CAI8278096.1 MAG: 50S ribosomal protein L13 [Bacteroidetes bacterium MED-G17]|tara:strand:+ start:2630 stop:3070 length:441 start_codon:yes stop_codon:yes gene_type:complete